MNHTAPEPVPSALADTGTERDTDTAPDITIGRRVLRMEIDALEQLSLALDARFSRAVAAMLAVKGRVICAGIGKSGHVARKIAATFASTGQPAHFVHPTEASHGDLGMISRDDLVLALSRSGETAELSDLIAYTRRFEIPLLSMTAKADSTLGRAGDVLLLVPDAPEACGETNAPTTSTTLMMALGDALAVALLERRGFKAADFKMFHPGGKLGSMLKTAGDIMHVGEELPLVAAGAPLAEAVATISAKGFGCVAVVDAAGRLAGAVTDGDLRRLVARGGLSANGEPATNVDAIMTRTPLTAEPATLAANLLRTMNDRKITQIFVVADGRPVGLVHMHDLLRAGVV